MFRFVCSDLFIRIRLLRFVSSDSFVQSRWFRFVPSYWYIYDVYSDLFLNIRLFRFVYSDLCVQIRLFRFVSSYFFLHSFVHIRLFILVHVRKCSEHETICSQKQIYSDLFLCIIDFIFVCSDSLLRFFGSHLFLQIRLFLLLAQIRLFRL